MRHSIPRAIPSLAPSHPLRHPILTAWWVPSCACAVSCALPLAACRHYPVDVQRLSLVMCVNCANEGIVPVRFNLWGEMVVSVSKDTFSLSNLWELHNRASIEHERITPMPETTYPALRLSALVVRRPLYFYVHVIVPMSSLTFLALLRMHARGNRTLDRRRCQVVPHDTLLVGAHSRCAHHSVVRALVCQSSCCPATATAPTSPSASPTPSLSYSPPPPSKTSLPPRCRSGSHVRAPCAQERPSPAHPTHAIPPPRPPAPHRECALPRSRPNCATPTCGAAPRHRAVLISKCSGGRCSFRNALAGAQT